MTTTIKKFTASLHTHVRSLYDAYIEPNALCEKIKELNGEGCAITDHGVLSSIEDYRPVFKQHGLKLIPGCELYIDGGILGRLHIIVLAKNDHGYKGITKMVTKANHNIEGEGKNAFPVLKKDDLFSITKEYKGDIIALSACMQGIISTVFLLNRKVDAKIAKLKAKQEKYISPVSEYYKKACEEVKSSEEEYKKAVLKRDETKFLAEMKFSKREKALEKAKALGEDVSLQEKELTRDRELSANAAKILPFVKEELYAANRKFSAAKKHMKDLEKSVETYNEYSREIRIIQSKLRTDAELEEITTKEAREYLDNFGTGNFYMEVQYHRIEEEAYVFPSVVKVAKKLNIPLVATNDVHMLDNSEKSKFQRNIQKSLRFGEDFVKEETGDSELYLKDNYELSKILSEILDPADVNEAIENIDVIFNQCNVSFETGKHYPKFSNENADDVLDREIEKGIKWRFPDGMDEEHAQRLSYEISVIKSMGYSDYHLIVKDFLEYGRLLGYVPKEKLENAPLSIEKLRAFIEKEGYDYSGMLVGPGRGSAVGSLACYILGITNLDPLKYGLLFERFLNPERISMPDIDSDLSNTTRGKVIEYVRTKYGANAICGIMTMTTQSPKGAIRIAAKYYGLKKYGENLIALGDTIAKLVTKEVGVKFSSKVNPKTGLLDSDGITLMEYLNENFGNNEDALAIIEWASYTEGLPTAYGAHAAGIVISDNDDISDYLPLKYNSELGMMTTQCDMVQVEDNGLLKFDFLGLKTLDIITEAIRMIEENHGIVIDPLKIDLSDCNVYKEILSKGKTNSVFQFESDGMKAMLKRFKPSSFEDLIILVSMFRPGPLQYLDDVIEVKNGRKKMEFLHPSLEPILGKTYAAIVYQEQVMEICQKLAGYTLGGADMVRRYMSKKKADKLEHEREKFIRGCQANSIDKEIAETLFEQMMDFAKYAFNKSHAAAYAYNAYITAFLKYYYPAEFLASALNWADDMDDIAGLIAEANDLGVKVLQPDINVSRKEMYVVNGSIRFGLGQIKGVSSQADLIIKNRENGPYVNINDFLFRVFPNKTVINNLADAGAFDSFNDNRKALKKYIDNTKDIIKKIKEKKKILKSLEFCLPFVEKASVSELVKLQEENDITVAVNREFTVEKLERKITLEKNNLKTMERELSLIKIIPESENVFQKLSAEKACLGMYITSHPLNYYPEPEEIGATPIAGHTPDSSVLLGIISGLAIKARKKDGAEMAFFTLQDKTGQCRCCCFNREYDKFKFLIQEDKVVKLIGSFLEDTYSDNDEMNFIIREVREVKEKQPALMMSVSSYASFHLDIEDIFRKNYEEKNGRTFLVFDEALNEIREISYKISEKILGFKNVVEV